MVEFSTQDEAMDAAHPMANKRLMTTRAQSGCLKHKFSENSLSLISTLQKKQIRIIIKDLKYLIEMLESQRIRTHCSDIGLLIADYTQNVDML